MSNFMKKRRKIKLMTEARSDIVIEASKNLNGAIWEPDIVRGGEHVGAKQKAAKG